MEFSGFTIITEKHKLSNNSEYNNLLFIKYNEKIYIEIFDYISLPVIITFDELMKNDYLKLYYELSLTAIGKPNIDRDYYESDCSNCVPTINEKNNSIYVDTIYIVKDDLNHAQEAKKGNCYHTLNIEMLKEMKVSTDAKIDEFFENYNKKFGYEEENFEERKATYTALVNDL